MTSDEVFVLTAIGGENPCAFVQSATASSAVEGYVVCRVGNHTFPVQEVNVFRSRADASSAAAARLRLILADISARYAKEISRIEESVSA